MESVREHLMDRGVNTQEYFVHVDEEERVATFMLYALGTGKLLGYQQYRPEGPKTRDARLEDPRQMKYYTYLTKAGLKHPDSVAVFGTEKFDPHDRVVFLVEGVFDAVAIHALGYNALAVLCNNPKPMKAFFRALGMKTVGVLDNDEAGRLLAKHCDDFVLCAPGEDPASMGKAALKSLLESML